MNRNNSGTFSCEAKTLRRKNSGSGKVCSHKVSKAKMKKQVKQVPEVTPLLPQTGGQNEKMAALQQ